MPTIPSISLPERDPEPTPIRPRITQRLHEQLTGPAAREQFGREAELDDLKMHDPAYIRSRAEECVLADDQAGALAWYRYLSLLVPAEPDPALAELEALVTEQARRAEEGDPLDGLPASWRPVNFEPVLDGTYEAPKPTIGRRADGVTGLFYPGRLHSVAAESEGGKTWLALAACLDEMHAGRKVLYLDFEDDESLVIGRLVAMGAPGSLIREKFLYVRPEEPVIGHRTALEAALRAWEPSLVVLDGVTEAMVRHGLNPLDLVDTTKFRVLLTALATSGAAVVALDHVTKDREGRGRYAIGSVHKLNGVNGAQYLLENRKPFGIGLYGVSTIRVGKDRPGELRRAGVASAGGLTWFADLVVDARDDIAEVSVEAPVERDEDFRPTVIMSRISELHEQHGDMSQRQLLDLLVIKAKTETKRQAHALLIAEGYLTAGKPPHHLIKPFRHADE